MKGFLLVVLAVLAVRGEVPSSEVVGEGFVPQFPTKLDESKTLKKFVKLVEEHKLNVTVLISTVEKWNDGSVREAMTLAVTLPANDAKPKESTLNKDVAKQFLKVASSENLSAQGIKAASGEDKKYMTNNPFGWPTEKAFDITTEALWGPRVFKAENFGAQYTFIIPSAAGNTTQKVLYGDLEIEVVTQKGFNAEETAAAVEALRIGFFEYEWEDIPQVIVTSLEKQWPKIDWQVALDISEDSWINSEKVLELKNMDTLYTIFAIQ